MQYVSLADIAFVFINQVPLFLTMILEMGYEWIIAVFISTVYLVYPTLAIIFMFSTILQQKLLNKYNFWSIWFIILFQVSALFVNQELLAGSFAGYFNIP